MGYFDITDPRDVMELVGEYAPRVVPAADYPHVVSYTETDRLDMVAARHELVIRHGGPVDNQGVFEEMTGAAEYFKDRTEIDRFLVETGVM